MSLPETLDDLAHAVGVYQDRVMDLAGVREAQHRLAELVLEAAEERWGDVVDWAVEGSHDAAWENAKERWPGAEKLADGLNAAEREILRGRGPLA